MSYWEQNIKNLILMKYKIKKKKTNYLYSTQINTQQRSLHILSYWKSEKKKNDHKYY